MKAPPRIQSTLIGVLALLNVSGQVLAQHPLDSWVRRPVPTPNSALNSIAYGNGTFVAVGNNSFVARSTDGITWSTGTAGAYGTLKRIRFMDGQFVALGSSDKLIYSPDGASWTVSTLPRADFWDIAYGNGVYVLAGSATYVSSNGVNWTQTHPMLFEYWPVPGVHEAALDTVVFANGLFQALRVGGQFSDIRSFSSTNGVDWVAGGIGQNGGGGTGDLLYQDGVWFSVMEGLSTDYNYGVSASTNNGASWSRRVDNGINPISGTALAYGQGQYVAVLWANPSGPGRIRVIRSTDGFLSWAESSHETNGTAVARGCAFGNGTFVAVGYDEKSESYIMQSGNISGAPIIFQEPQDRSAVVDNPVTFSVQAVGAPPLWYQWYKDGTAIGGATNTSYTIDHVATGDVGGYHVVVTNSIDSVTSRVAQLTVAFLGISQYAGIKILGVPGRTYRIEATPASGAANWQTLTNLPLPATPYIWIDYESPTVPARIYRAAELP